MWSRECITRCWVTQDMCILICVLLSLPILVTAQKEGDTGYYDQQAYAEYYEPGVEPEFEELYENVTVVAGRMAVLPCTVHNFGKYKVAWMDPHGLVLTYDDQRVVDDNRFSVQTSFYEQWNLRIQEVTREDHGNYTCRVNTDPLMDKHVHLNVIVPPTIIDELSSDDVTVQEGDTMVLVCSVTGVPQPEVTWYRYWYSASNRGTLYEKIGDGETLVMRNVSRVDRLYECVATNGVPPDWKRLMRVDVEYAPDIRIPNKYFEQSQGQTAIIECVITAYPWVLNYWERYGFRISNTPGKFTIEAYDEGEHTITLSLTITDIQPEDYGEYHCVATNSLGSDTGVVQIYELQPEFDELYENVTVVAGDSAVLPCTVHNLGTHTVAWYGSQTMPLTIGEFVFTSDHRVGVQRSHNDWNLLIMDVTPEDQGEYNCRTTTRDPKEKLVFLIVEKYAPWN